MYFDGSYTLKGVGAGVVLIPPEYDVLKYAIQIEFPITNNTAEYEGMFIGLRLAKKLGIQQLLIWSISNYKHPEEAEWKLDPIDSSMRSHQDEGNSGVIESDRRFKILLIYSCCQYTRSLSNMQKKKATKPWAVIVIGLGKTSKII
jgi:hypothetical protein